MKKRNWILVAGIIGIVAVAAYTTRSSWMGSNASAQGPQRPRMVSVELAKAERKSVPVDVDANGTVTPISSVALKSRLETTILSVHFQDGAKVNEGDLLFTLDARQIDAQIEQAEGVLAKDRAQLEGALRDVRRFSELIGKGATTQVNLDNAKTTADILAGTIKSDQASLDNLKVQKSYTTIRAPFSGRISVANVKVGNFVRPADTAPLAVINQMAPVYVTFAVPQRVLVDLRESMAKGVSGVTATIPGHQRSETGKVAMVENTVDATTGMVTVRGIMSNENETLWPGTLVATRLTIRSEDAIVVPTVAVQRSQTGNFVFVVKDGTAKVQPVTVDRTSQGMSVISEGLAGDESVVVDGQLLLSDGTRVEPRTKKAGA
ncbi:efflux RND transporter periplasmic adaptor subunit [Bradyrhizobium sp. AUGA SZCCT0240]|jgi:RND family efflux transporter MFP subunit|uniref:efflux RND transporter periplasmic adaptor subunit n=1 Tax=unclassified Bradyrhizobium TaxID=2631580 RepID=UPI001BA45AA7|nr:MULTISPECIES: efflux RND transporter periplasmic adaptor subunit [unclassified Bradyrhizobium]MBR1193978.1 efflux RND transporter periplasmic adaptor subunit [Bradyrhizobium sp. AUGA SZCCT0160]MBR1200898.1 efflux RND transporter periplasmic adaptor subunit [Bradyrhizobium sp. AUGA SZCCT0158]MBR1243377.1 efflux RND transporter periplasmic adaptor subunit [Bradyrhizobium sp. AUGA SZCCT0274]MBR1249608.1 efflux RND transporter periplasmic adaptor subunit [Bradyrhizobium sp. AUGA SZCCT0169]MBR12